MHSKTSDIVSIVSSCANGKHCSDKIKELFNINWEKVKAGKSKIPKMQLHFPIEKAIETAIPNAKTCDIDTTTKLIKTRGSRIYRLMEAILNSKAHSTY